MASTSNDEKYSISLILLKPNSTYGFDSKSYRVNKDPSSLTLQPIGWNISDPSIIELLIYFLIGSVTDFGLQHKGETTYRLRGNLEILV